MVKKSAKGLQTQTDPRDENGVTGMKLNKRPKEDAELGDPMATYMSLLAMLFGILAIIFKVIYMKIFI